MISVEMTLTFIQGQSCMGYQKVWCPFLLFFFNFAADLDEVQYVAITCWFVEAHASFILN